MQTLSKMGSMLRVSHRFALTVKAVLIFLTLFPLPCLSQSNPAMDKLAGQIQSTAKNAPPETVYLQTSKGIYESGEDLWFKAYVLNSQSYVASPLSRTLYLQLLDEGNKKAVWQEKYEVLNGLADGQVYLPDSLAEGDYILEGFTANSFYADSGRFSALRRVRIVKSYRSIVNTLDHVAATSGKAGKTAIQFDVFPEGGKLIGNLPATLGFKAVDTNGAPITVSGNLFEDGKILQSFKSVHAGMGSLSFTPSPSKSYTIRLDGTDSLFQLPKIHPGGMSLRLVKRDSGYLYFEVSKTADVAAQTVYLRGQLRGLTYCIASGRLEDSLHIKMPLKEFSSQGIAEFTLFNGELLPMAERLAYVHPEKKLHITAELSGKRFKTREKASVKIRVSDENGRPIVADLGISVYDKLYGNTRDPKNILTHFYLSTQLRGSIYDPAYYFGEKNGDREKALDLLLMTQGWRNYVWSEDNLKAYTTVKHPIMSEGTDGEVHFTKKLKQAPKGEQFVMAFSPDEKGETKNIGLFPTDSTGRFVIGPQELSSGQGSYVYLKPMGQPDFEPRISVNDPFGAIEKTMRNKHITYPLPPPSKKAAETPERYEARPMSINLGEVVIKGKGPKVFRDKYLGRLDSLAKAELNTDFVCHHAHHVLNCFEHKGDPRDIKPVEGKTYMVLLGKDGEILGADYPNNFFFGSKIIIYHNPNLIFTENELLKRNNLTRIKGYYHKREFYQPNYDKEPAGDGTPDARNTLLWAPSVITDKNGEATLSFYTSDINTNFLGRIEGVSGSGLLGMCGFEFLVRKTNKP